MLRLDFLEIAIDQNLTGNKGAYEVVINCYSVLGPHGVTSEPLKPSDSIFPLSV